MKSIFNLSALTILSSLFFGLFSNITNEVEPTTDLEIYQLIERDLENQFPQIAKADMVSHAPNENEYLMADFDVELTTSPWYNEKNELIGINISGVGDGLDQNLNTLKTAFITKINFDSGKKWGSQIIVAPGDYSVKYRQTQNENPEIVTEKEQMFFAGMNSIETRGGLEGQGSSAIRYEAYNQTISDYTQLLSYEQIEGQISLHAYIN